jgi:predicted ATPase
MLMDLFARTHDEGTCTRLHFHELMVEVHQQLHKLHQSRPKVVVLTKQGLPVFKFGDAPSITRAEASLPASNASHADTADPRPRNGVAANDPHRWPKDKGTAASDATAGDAAASANSTAAAPPASASASPPLSIVADTIALRGAVLCLDEMQVTDVADAMLLRQLFEGLFERGVRVVFTSNRPPEELYERGLNRKYFLPFVELLRERADVRRVGEAGNNALDYRSLPPPSPQAEDERAKWHSAASRHAPATRTRGTFVHGHDAEAQLACRWDQHVARLQRGTDGTADTSLANASLPEAVPVNASLPEAVPAVPSVPSVPSLPEAVPVAFGRSLALRRRAGDACWLTFYELCCTVPGVPALGVTDYLALASVARTVFISGLPVLDSRQRNEARRLVALIDALYEARVQLHLAAEAPLEDLFRPLLEGRDTEMMGGAEVDVSSIGGEATGSAATTPATTPSFEAAPVAGRYQRDGELATFFTAKDERFMMRRTLSRLTEMLSVESRGGFTSK